MEALRVIYKKIKTAPAVEPLSVEEVKTYLKIDGSATSEDDYLDALIKAARAAVEKYTGRALITQTWYGYPEEFPLSDEQPLELPCPPLVSITSIIYYDYNDVATTLPAIQYYTDTATMSRGRIFIKDAYSWPTDTLRRSMPIIVEFICGYGASSSYIPSGIVTALYQLIAYWYENRGDQTPTVGAVPPVIQYLLESFVLVRL